MRRFLIYITIALVFFGVIVCSIEFIMPYVIDNEYTKKYRYITTYPENIQILLLGNSYAENSINPYCLGDSVYDAAISARWIYWDKELLRNYGSTMKNLKTVIYPMGYKMPFVSSAHYKNPYSTTRIVYRYVKYMHLNYDKCVENQYHHCALIHGHIHIEEFKSNVYSDSLGYCPLGGVCKNFEHIQNIPSDIHIAYDAVAQVTEYTQYLTDMAHICYEHNVRFIVVTPPCHDSFVANTRPEGIATLHQIIEDVRKEYPIEYKDYLQDSAYRADSLYFNCSHLNSIGATKFGAQIKADFNL